MKYRYILGTILLSMVLWACEKAPLPNDNYIRLNARVSNPIEVIVRAQVDEYRGIYPSIDNPLYADVWFSLEPGVFPHNPQPDTNIPCHSHIKYEGEITDPISSDASGADIQPAYPTDDSPVYCVGFYPATTPNSSTEQSWTLIDEQSTTVSRNINGYEDLMFAPQISGTWSNPMRFQDFNHLLTWVRVVVNATSVEAPESWGDIKKISIVGKESVEIELGRGNISYTGNEKEFDVLSPNDPKIELTTALKEVGEILCSPPHKTYSDSDDTMVYTVRVETENHTKEIDVKLQTMDGTPITSSSNIKAQLIIINLQFNKFNIIDGVCTLNTFENENNNLYLQ